MPAAQNLVLLALALLAGVATAFQPGINARFALVSGARVHGGVANFAVGLACVLLATLVMRAGVPDHARLAQGPWWMWLGGVLGAFFVLTAIVIVPKVGAANYMAAAIAGQLIASALIDHFGLMGLAAHAFTPGRALGIALIAAGVACVRWL
ncbi:MAG: DMT family transporter [Phycisphaeraceae bacterium]|nr:MAG: DMT family transporter [Phycisphaeraceae bacterium]